MRLIPIAALKLHIVSLRKEARLYDEGANRGLNMLTSEQCTEVVQITEAAAEIGNTAQTYISCSDLHSFAENLTHNDSVYA